MSPGGEWLGLLFLAAFCVWRRWGSLFEVCRRHVLRAAFGNFWGFQNSENHVEAASFGGRTPQLSTRISRVRILGSESFGVDATGLPNPACSSISVS
jgi:hypothetical protein